MIPLDSRERRRRRVRAEIEAKALELFVARGYGATTVEQIATACGISPRTFFRYFPSKSAVIFADLEADVAEMIGLIGSRPAFEGPYAALRAATLSFSERLMRRGEVVTMRSQLVRQDPHVAEIAVGAAARWTELVSQALAARGGRRADEAFRVIATLGAEIMIGALHDWDGAGDLRGAVEAMFERVEAEVAAARTPTTGLRSGAARRDAPSAPRRSRRPDPV